MPKREWKQEDNTTRTLPLYRAQGAPDALRTEDQDAPAADLNTDGHGHHHGDSSQLPRLYQRVQAQERRSTRRPRPGHGAA